MRLPTIQGVIDRRILVNYRVHAEVLAGLLPAPFRPKLYQGYGLVGICLIRLRGVRPRYWPAWLGMGSENAAHRAAVEWTENGITREGVYIRRRDTNSRLTKLLGGRLFPGFHSHATFTVNETNGAYHIAVRSDDGATTISVAAQAATTWPADSIFPTLDEASAFYQAGSLGYSATPSAGRFQGLSLQCENWRVAPLLVSHVQSSYFDDPRVFPPGSIAFDNALLMFQVKHSWQGHSDLCCAPDALPNNISTEIPASTQILI